MTELQKIRLRIKDPYGVLYFETVTELPSEYDAQTAYLFEDRYYVDGDQVLLKVSDTQLEEWLEDGDINTATILALRSCKAGLAQELFVVKTDSGADSQEFQDLEALSNFYDDQIDYYEDQVCKSKSSTFKKYGKFRSPDFVSEV